MSLTARGVCRIVTGVMLVSVAGLPVPATAQDTRARPPLEGWRLAGEVVVGSYAGFAGYFVGRYVGSRVGDQWFAGAAHEGLRRSIKHGAGYVAGGFATAGAVYGVGSIDGQTAKFWTTLGGTGAGFVVAAAVNRYLLNPPRQGESSGGRFMRRTGEVLEVLLPSIGATMAYNSTRRFAR